VHLAVAAAVAEEEAEVAAQEEDPLFGGWVICRQGRVGEAPRATAKCASQDPAVALSLSLLLSFRAGWKIRIGFLILQVLFCKSTNCHRVFSWNETFENEHSMRPRPARVVLLWFVRQSNMMLFIQSANIGRRCFCTDKCERDVHFD